MQAIENNPIQRVRDTHAGILAGAPVDHGNLVRAFEQALQPLPRMTLDDGYNFAIGLSSGSCLQNLEDGLHLIITDPCDSSGNKIDVNSRLSDQQHTALLKKLLEYVKGAFPDNLQPVTFGMNFHTFLKLKAQWHAHVVIYLRPEAKIAEQWRQPEESHMVDALEITEKHLPTSTASTWQVAVIEGAEGDSLEIMIGAAFAKLAILEGHAKKAEDADSREFGYRIQFLFDLARNTARAWLHWATQSSQGKPARFVDPPKADVD